MDNYILETKELTKSYGRLSALNDFSVKLKENKIYGLLGRNGAGKTTLLNLITSKIFADKGTVKLFGEDGIENQKMLSEICYMPEKNLFIPTMRASEILESAALFYKNFDMNYAHHLCDKFDLNVKKKYQALSKGYESILRIVIGLATRAALTIFDEPVLALDAAARDDFYRELLKDYSSHPRSFIISTHLIEESADVFEEVIIIKEGRLVEHTTVDALKLKAYYVSGKAEVVDEAVAGMHILFTETVGTLKICAIFESFTKEMLSKLSSMGLDISPIPIQKLFIYLTNREKEDAIHG